MGLSVFSSVFSLLLLIFSAGSTDLLSLMSTSEYWQAKGKSPTTTELIADVEPAKVTGDVKKLVEDLSSPEFKTRDAAQKALARMGPDVVPLLKGATESKDAEVADSAKGIVAALTEHAKSRDMERLMAIRTLGEKKEQSALAALKEAEKSKEPFVADYALRAVEEIEGQPVTPVDHRGELEKDVWLMPKDTGTVVQASGSSWMGKIDIPTILDKLGAAPAPGMPVPNKGQLESQLSAGLVKVVERIGDVRIDGATLGVSADVSNNSGWAVALLRAQFDRPAVVAAIKSLAGEDAPLTHEGGADVFTPEESTKIAFFDGCVMLVSSDKKETTEALFGTMAKALASGQGELKGNEKMAGLIARADRKGPMWGVSELPEAIKKAEADFSPYDTVVLGTAVKENSLTFSITATGSDAEQMKASSDKMEGEVADAVKEAKQMIAQVPPQFAESEKGEIAFMESLKFKTAGTTTVLSGEVSNSVVELLKSTLVEYVELLGPEMMQGEAAQQEVAPASQP
ncbi:MAG TPA: HEAT repeat domain-containing protein [Phycisphaerae bacterium]|nr:HEAT repeat domain-containing protein [Phycisphaerae bacterium]